MPLAGWLHRRAKSQLLGASKSVESTTGLQVLHGSSRCMRLHHDMHTVSRVVSCITAALCWCRLRTALINSQLGHTREHPMLASGCLCGSTWLTSSRATMH